MNNNAQLSNQNIPYVSCFDTYSNFYVFVA